MVQHPTDDRVALLEHDLAALRAEVAVLRRHPRRHRMPRLVTALLLAIILALIPVLVLADFAFLDLNSGSPHNDNIKAIADAGITKGCNPPTNDNYCPNDFVTREQMASFLARTAGLGSNPPVANAKTAQTAQNAVNATNATSATTAGNATTVGGYAPNALIRVGTAVQSAPINTARTEQVVAQVTLTLPGPGYVLVFGALDISITTAGTSDFVYAYVRDLTSGNSSPTLVTIPQQGVGTGREAFSPSYLFTATAAGPRTFALMYRNVQSTINAQANNGAITALFVPFGADGGSAPDFSSTGGSTLTTP